MGPEYISADEAFLQATMRLPPNPYIGEQYLLPGTEHRFCLSQSSGLPATVSPENHFLIIIL